MAGHAGRDRRMRDRLAVGVKRQALLLDRDDDLQRSFRHLLGCLGLEVGSGIGRVLALRRLALDLGRRGVQVRGRDGDGPRLEEPCGVGRHCGDDHGRRDARAQQAAPAHAMRSADKPSGDFELHDSQSPNLNECGGSEVPFAASPSRGSLSHNHTTTIKLPVCPDSEVRIGANCTVLRTSESGHWYPARVSFARARLI